MIEVRAVGACVQRHRPLAPNRRGGEGEVSNNQSVSFSHCREERFHLGTMLNSVEGGEEKTSVELKPRCYLNSRGGSSPEIRQGERRRDALGTRVTNQSNLVPVVTTPATLVVHMTMPHPVRG